MLKASLILLIPAGLCGLLFLAETTYSPAKHRAYPASYRVEEKYAEARKRVAEAHQNVNVKDDEYEGDPELVVTNTEHNFGILEPDTEYEHEFVIRNTGSAPLRLSQAGKTCLCVGFEVDRWTVMPGEQAVATLRWNTKQPTSEYRHGASLNTNDPDVPVLKFRVNGSVLTQLAFSDRAFIFSKLWPGQERTGELTLFSEALEDFEIEEIRISNPAFKVTSEPVPADELHVRQKKAYRVFVTTPSELPRGNFSEELTVKVNVTKGPLAGETKELQIGVQGYVAKRFTLFGDLVSSTGVVDFSVVSGTKGKKAIMMLRINDELKDVNLQSIETTPDFLKVELEPQNLEKGLYRLTIEVLPFSPQGTFTADTAGKIRLLFDHPRIPELELDFHAVILPHGG